MVGTECVNAESLARYVRGELDLDAMEAVESHLLQCGRCASEADTLNPLDDVTTNFSSTPSIDVDDSLVASAIQKALAAFTNRNLHETVGVSQHDTGSHADASADTEIDFLAPPELDDEMGRLGGYRILEELGAGGMGIVFRAEDPRLKRAVAIKVMRPRAAAVAESKERFLREAQSAAAIEHDNVVTILQVGEDRGVPFIAMPLLKGESLRERLDREGALGENEVLAIGKQIAEGLAEAHRLGLIHRDIKPDNIWLEPRGRVKLLDFGLARMTNEDQSLTQSGTVLGTPRYMAPEQASGEVVDRRSDLFSLGSVLYHLVSGRPPFDGKNLTAMLIAVAQANPEPLTTVAPETRPKLAALVSKLLSKDPAKRFSSAESIANELTALQKSAQTQSASQAKSNTASSKFTASVWIGLLMVAVLGTIITVRLSDGTKVVIESDQDVEAITIEPNDSLSDSKTPGARQNDEDSRENTTPVSPKEARPSSNEGSMDSQKRDQAQPKAGVSVPGDTVPDKVSTAVQKLVHWPDPPGYEFEIRLANDRPGMLLTGNPIPTEPFEINGIFFSTNEGRAFTDDDMDYLIAAGLTELRTFGLKGQTAKAEWVDRLAEHQRQLQGIFFEKTASIDVFRSLLKMPNNLQSLILGGELNDECLEQIVKIRSLNALHFDMEPEDWSVSESRLQLIAKLSNLTLLYFYKFKPDNLDELQEKLPACRIHFRDADGALKILGSI